MLHEWIKIWFEWVQVGGYWGVFALMALESTIVPVPSELVMPPAAFWAAQGHMNFWGVVAAGGTGSYFGSALSYLFCRWAGEKFIPRYGRYFFLTEAKIQVASVTLEKYGAFGVFIARLMPVVRHLISIPAGLFRMNFTKFSVVTLFGATLWCFILAIWGERVLGAHPELLNSPADMMHAIRSEMFWFVAAVAAFGVLYWMVVWYRRRLARRAAQTPPMGPRTKA